jgi:hypothetical protein
MGQKYAASRRGCNPAFGSQGASGDKAVRAALKVVAGILFAFSTLATILGLVALVSDSSSQLAFNAAILGGAVTSLLLSGAVWLLADIAESVRRHTPQELEAERLSR